MSEYLVLARKYRPQVFEDLVGQEVLVRTLSNAIESNRIAHAFVLTGIRGIGKTTTARIMAKALNCLGVDGTLKGATASPCGTCANCVQITQGRHVDVIEMDAASNTGVDDVRIIIDAVHYRPTSARFKVYIIDEAHMLSKNAFNALLKTLEEPPAHIVFIFATTEIRKVPVTILSRCQRFDLRRLNNNEMTMHLRSICEREQINAGDDALELISIASEGSVRDALSLLDQAVVHGRKDEQGQYHIDGNIVRDLLGLVDRTRLYSMLEHLFAGRCNEALESLEAQYSDGANLSHLVGDLLSAVHIISRLLIAKDYKLDHSFSAHENEMLNALANSLSIPAAMRAWQVLTKGLEEIKAASNALNATEMLFIRFAYMAELPDPADIIRQLKEGGGVTSKPSGTPSNGEGGSSMTLVRTSSLAQQTLPRHDAQLVLQASPHLSLVTHNNAFALTSFEQVLDLLEEQKEQILLYHVSQHIRVVSCKASELVISRECTSSIPQEVFSQFREMLKRLRGWNIVLSDEQGDATVAERKETAKRNQWEAAKNHPLVISILETFDGAAMIGIEPDTYFRKNL